MPPKAKRRAPPAEADKALEAYAASIAPQHTNVVDAQGHLIERACGLWDHLFVDGLLRPFTPSVDLLVSYPRGHYGSGFVNFGTQLEMKGPVRQRPGDVRWRPLVRAPHPPATGGAGGPEPEAGAGAGAHSASSGPGPTLYTLLLADVDQPSPGKPDQRSQVLWAVANLPGPRPGPAGAGASDSHAAAPARGGAAAGSASSSSGSTTDAVEVRLRLEELQSLAGDLVVGAGKGKKRKVEEGEAVAGAGVGAAAAPAPAPSPPPAPTVDLTAGPLELLPFQAPKPQYGNHRLLFLLAEQRGGGAGGAGAGAGAGAASSSSPAPAAAPLRLGPSAAPPTRTSCDIQAWLDGQGLVPVGLNFACLHPEY